MNRQASEILPILFVIPSMYFRMTLDAFWFFWIWGKICSLPGRWPSPGLGPPLPLLGKPSRATRKRVYTGFRRQTPWIYNTKILFWILLKGGEGEGLQKVLHPNSTPVGTSRTSAMSSATGAEASIIASSADCSVSYWLVSRVVWARVDSHSASISSSNQYWVLDTYLSHLGGWDWCKRMLIHDSPLLA